MCQLSRFIKKLDAPFSIRSAIVIKIVGIFGIFFAAFAVLYSGLSAPIADPYKQGIFIVASRPDIFMAAGVVLIHLLYLRIVFDEYIIDKAVENVTIKDVVFPFLLVTVYVLYGLNSLANNTGFLTYRDNLKLSSYIAFMLLYGIWILRDWHVKKWRTSARTAIWIVVDIISIITLLFYFFGFHGLPLFNYVLTPKDLAVSSCVLFWFLIHEFAWLQRRNYYADEYKNYLDHNLPVRIHGENVPELDVQNLSEVIIVDIGCGNGSRLVELIIWMKSAGHLKADVRITAFGYDRDDSWCDKFKNTCKDSDLTPEFIMGCNKEVLEEQLSRANVILLSHVLYELQACCLVSRLLLHCKDGTLVVARGIAARSFFTVVNLTYSRRLWPKPTISHLWRSHGLRSMIASGRLKEIASCLIEQPFRLDRGGMNDAKKLLDYLYGEGAAQLAGEYFSMLVEEGRTEVPNDDVFVFLKILDKRSPPSLACGRGVGGEGSGFKDLPPHPSPLPLPRESGD